MKNNIKEIENTHLAVSNSISLPQYEYDIASILKTTIISGAAAIPVVGSVFSYLIDIFWPSEKSNLWEQILSKVEEMIESANLKTIQGILLGDINEIKVKIFNANKIIDENPGSSEAHDSFIRLAEYLEGKDQKFRSFDDKTNYQILPMYSLTLILQFVFWKRGLEERKDISLTDIEYNEIKRFLEETITSATSYINGMYEREYKNAINSASADSIANDILSVRGHCLLHGVETLEILEHLQNNPINSSFTPKTISYSTLFDRATSKSKILALTPDNKMTQPLKPDWIGNTYNKIRAIKGYVQRIGGAPRVGGLEINFIDGQSYQLGTRTGENLTSELGDAFIVSIEVWGYGAVDKIIFTYSDGKTFTFGETPTSNYRKFSVDGHCISGIFMASDESSLAGQAAGIMVSYQLLPH